MADEISGRNIFKSFFVLLIVGACFALCYWLVGQLHIPAPFGQVAYGVLAFLAVLFLVNFLLGLVGKNFVNW